VDESSRHLLANRLASHQSVGVDSAIFIYQFEAHPIYHPLAHIVLSGIIDQRYEGVTSVMTITEITVHSWRANMEMIAREYESLLAHFPNLHLAEVNRDIARRAARLRADFGIRTPDALQVATAVEHRATAFVTNDRALRRLNGVLDIIVLQEFVRE
jgi:uncharacterized protein